MYSNEHATRLDSLTYQAGQINRDIQKWQTELNWFSGFDCERASSSLAQVRRDLLESRQRLDEIDSAIESNQKRQDECQASSSTSWLSRLWPSSEEAVARRLVVELEMRLKSLQQHRSAAQEKLASDEPNERKLAADLGRYRSFDPLEAEATITRLGEELAGLQRMMDHVRIASDRWESMVGNVWREWRKAQLQLNQINEDIAKAESFDQALSTAFDGKERAKIHGWCESYFEDGSPKAVKSRLARKRRELTHEVDKKEGRLRDVIRLLEKQIETLIIDGNNLCYAPSENGKGKFIGLEALAALVPHLCQTYKVTLFFDPGIRQRLSMTDASLKAVFPGATVMVMRSKATADEGILAAAEFDQTAYIVSNDRFADYPEQPAVKERRILPTSFTLTRCRSRNCRSTSRTEVGLPPSLHS